MPETETSTLVDLPGARPDGAPPPAEKIQVSMGDMTFHAGRRTAAHLEWTFARLARKHPHAHLNIIQSCYHTGVDASAGTHDGDGVLDIKIEGLEWLKAQKFMRRNGWAAWFRPENDTWINHVHVVSLGCPGPVGVKIPGQVTQYHNDQNGFEIPGPDGNWHPKDIAATVFDYPKYLSIKEDTMPYRDWPKADQKALIEDLVDAMMRARVDDGVTLAQAAKQAASSPGLIRNLSDQLALQSPP